MASKDLQALYEICNNLIFLAG